MVHPETNVAELVGGPADGIMIESSYLPRRVLFTLIDGEFRWLTSTEEAEKVSVGEIVYVYGISKAKTYAGTRRYTFHARRKILP